jgi:hypothetical protein
MAGTDARLGSWSGGQLQLASAGERGGRFAFEATGPLPGRWSPAFLPPSSNSSIGASRENALGPNDAQPF